MGEEGNDCGQCKFKDSWRYCRDECGRDPAAKKKPVLLRVFDGLIGGLRGSRALKFFCRAWEVLMNYSAFLFLVMASAVYMLLGAITYGFWALLVLPLIFAATFLFYMVMTVGGMALKYWVLNRTLRGFPDSITVKSKFKEMGLNLTPEQVDRFRKLAKRMLDYKLEVFQLFNNRIQVTDTVEDAPIAMFYQDEKTAKANAELFSVAPAIIYAVMQKLQCGVDVDGDLIGGMNYKRLCYDLWKILDDIDTMGDIAKSNDQIYRTRVEQLQEKRWKLAGVTEKLVDELYEKYHPKWEKEQAAEERKD